MRGSKGTSALLGAARPPGEPVNEKEATLLKLTRNRSATLDLVDATPHAGDDRLEGAQRATFAAGCFWGVEAAFREVEGVVKTTVGYTGGHTANPTYEQVCSHATGHAEAVEVWFDPAKVTYEQVLETFWGIHNPTTRDRQGWDIGNQYRSAIFHHDAGQEEIAIASRDRAPQQADRYRDLAGGRVLPGRGLPPALLREERPRLLCDHAPLVAPPKEARRVE